MAYKKIKPWKYTEEELRQLWSDTYCGTNEIFTFDGVKVKFYSNMFDHAFYESNNWKEKDKSIFSQNRCQKMLWIKDALQDPDAVIKKAWNKKTKNYFNNRRVTLVKGNYVVVIRFIKKGIAKFVTAYQKENIDKIINSPDWDGHEKWIK